MMVLLFDARERMAAERKMKVKRMKKEGRGRRSSKNEQKRTYLPLIPVQTIQTTVWVVCSY